MNERLILLTNDDGLGAPGLEVLTRIASRFGRTVVVAPDRNRSGISSALSLHSILRLNEISQDRYTCDGTPVDCVLLGVREILGKAPDWVLTGINHGWNLGEDVFYSGTVASAFEGALQGCRAAAFSADSSTDPASMASYVEHFLERWERLELPPNRIWNVNLPQGKPQGYRLTGQDNRTYHDAVERRQDPKGRSYYWIGGALPAYACTPGSDGEAVRDGWISITPLRMDLACPELMAQRQRVEELFNQA